MMTRQLRPLLLTCAVLILGKLLLSAWAWGQIPAAARIPTHFGSNGRPNGYSGKSVALLLIPGIALVTVALLAVLPRIDPRRPNLDRSARAYGAVMLLVVAILAYAHASIVLGAVGRPFGTAGVLGVVILVAVLFIVIGNYLGKIRSNFFFGIRTPWTLSSEQSWNRTHRLGGRLFVLLGIAILIGIPLGVAWLVMVAGIALLALALIPYSYWVWSRDPDRHRGPAPETTP